MRSSASNSTAHSRAPLAVAIAAALLLVTPLAWAQQPEQDENGEGVETADEAVLDQILVTGSRIPRAGFDTLEPAAVISREYTEQRGLTNIADVLNEAPGFGIGVTPEGAQSSFGVGVNFVNRFGLGSNRTLTVVNGRRFVSGNTATIFGPAAPGLQVDLNTIPTQMVDRVETLSVGGAPTYGTDAIAGTMNIILRNDYEGLELGGTYGLTEEVDNERIGASLLWGSNFLDNRANLTIGLTYDESDGVLQTERDYLRRGWFFASNPNQAVIEEFQPGRNFGSDGRFNTGIPFNTGSNDGIPNSVLIGDRRIFSTPPGGLAMPSSFPFGPDGALQGFGPDGDTLLAFDGSGNLVPYNQGFNFGLVDASGGDGLSLVDLGQITSQLDRTTLMAIGHMDVTDSTRAFFEMTFYEADSLELVAQPIYNSPLFGGLSAPIEFSATHPLLTPQAQQTLADLGQDSFFVSRASRDLVTNNSSADTRLVRTVFGFDGYFEIGNRAFNWEASANQGRNTSNFYATVLNQQHFINAINVSRVNGSMVCDPTAGNAGYENPALNTPVADPNCVPLDIFGEGRASDAARAYVTDRTAARSVIEQTVFNVNVSSTLVDLWSGPLQYNIGLERRIERAEFTPDPFQQSGLGRAVPITPTRGRFDTNEVFAELLLPLVDPNDDIAFLKRLDVTAKFRRVDNNLAGESDTYTYGLQYRPFDDFEIRGNVTRSLRAPSVTELFTPTASIFTFVPDPCDTALVGSGTRPDVRAANCAAFYEQFGLDPDNFNSIARTATIQGTTGGNLDLSNEQADSITYGFVWEPSFFSGFSAAVDYQKIEIDNVIANLDAASIATGCFDNTDFDPTDVTRANAFCERIIRDANGQITDIRTGFVNGAFLNFSGISADLLYTFDTRWGQFDVGWNTFNLRRLDNSTNAIVVVDQKGIIGNSELQHQLRAGWQGDRYGANMSVNYTSSARFDNSFTEETRDILEVDGFYQVNLGGNMRIGDRGIVRLAVTNLLDEHPPFPTVGFGTYDQLGRRYTLSANWRF